MFEQEIERLLSYGLFSGLIKQDDVYVTRNALLSHFGRSEPACDILPENDRCSLANILFNLIPPDKTSSEWDLEAAAIMGLLTPRASEIVEQWERLYAVSPQNATDYFYKLCCDNNYIQLERIKQNISWQTQTPWGKLEMTINLAKPEKDPKEIAAAKLLPKETYPKCLLCPENAGFSGNLKHPARQNLRLIPLTLVGERWYFQYSPYLYYQEHSIVLNENHQPMKIDASTFEKLLEFVERFPHYFIGSNADLPIVGGSILSHDHFQAGRHRFPLDGALNWSYFVHPGFPSVKASILKWPISTIRLRSPNRSDLAVLADQILKVWQNYCDPELGIFAFTGKQPHNTITPIARRTGQDFYELDIMLRNNKTSKKYPDGMFHFHQELHHLKKENIGLIEAMGLAILPGRLKNELTEIEKALCGKTDISSVSEKHRAFCAELSSSYGTANTKKRAEALIRSAVGRSFAQGLTHCGVFKHTEEGRSHFDLFTKACGFSRLGDEGNEGV
jgi:UDPglucose--hexose-1-phosphate uridylyltransferase